MLAGGGVAVEEGGKVAGGGGGRARELGVERRAVGRAGHAPKTSKFLAYHHARHVWSAFW